MKKFLSVICCICVLNVMHAKKDVDEIIVEVTKSYAATDQSVLDLDVSFAQVNVTAAAVNEIKVVMTASNIKADNSRCKSAVVEHFNKATNASGNTVSVNVDGVFDQCKERNSCNISVWVEITIPLKASITGDASFTNVNLGAMQGAAKLHVDYGNIDSKGLWAYDNDLKVEFGNLKISGTNGGNFEAEYGNVEIGQIQGSAIVDVEFGNVEVKHVMTQCTHLNVKVAYGNVDLNLDPSAGYAFEVKSAYGNIDLDGDFKVNFSEKDYAEVFKKGTVGNGSGKLYVKAEFGNIDIDRK
jgi:hypothetical protein